MQSPVTTKPAVSLRGVDSIPSLPAQQAHAAQALTSLAALANGNGVLSGQLRVQQADLEKAVVTAQIVIEPYAEITVTEQAGTHSHGDLVDHRQAFHDRVESFAKSLAQEQRVQITVADRLAGLPAQGWGMAETKISLDLPAQQAHFVQACQMCTAAEVNTCRHCGGTGKMTVLFDAVFLAKVSFAIDQDSFSQSPVYEDLKDSGLRKLIATDQTMVERLDFCVRENLLVYPLRAAFDYGVINFTLLGKTVQAKIAGKKGMILSADPFLDRLVKPGVAALYRIGKNTGVGAQPLLAIAARYRVLRQVIHDLCLRSRSETYDRLKKSYSAGLSDKYARGMIAYADNALRVLSVRPKRAAWGVGLLAAAGFYAIWFFTPLRSVLVSAFGLESSNAAQWFFDGLAFLTGWILCCLCFKHWATREYLKMIPASLRDVPLDKIFVKDLPLRFVQAFGLLFAVFVLLAVLM